MISNRLKQDTLNKLIDMTISNELTWSYLYENKELCEKNSLYPAYSKQQIENILRNNIYPDKLIFDARDSYVCMVKDFYFFIARTAPLYESEGITILMIAPPNFVNSESLYYPGAEDKISRLINLVSIKFPNSQECIEEFLKM